MLEKELEKILRKTVIQNGGHCYKFTSPGNVGVPDRIVVLPGGYIGFVELKRPGGKPTKNQILQLNRLTELGCRVYLLDTGLNLRPVLSDIRYGDRPGYRWEVQPL